MKFKVISLLGLAALLASCGSFSLAPSASVFSNIQPGLGFEQTTSGIVVVAPTITFQARAGSMGATITSYKAEFINSNGDYIYPGDFKTEGALGVHVSPGISCTTPTTGGCTSRSEGAQFDTGPISDSLAFGIMQGQYALAMIQHLSTGGTANNWRAKITFYGVADNGASVEWTEYEPIIFPLK